MTKMVKVVYRVEAEADSLVVGASMLPILPLRMAAEATCPRLYPWASKGEGTASTYEGASESLEAGSLTPFQANSSATLTGSINVRASLSKG